jgi:anti-sigma regulatory factor (Ser/Thr protein kinase)
MAAGVADTGTRDPLDERTTITVPAQLRFLELVQTAVRVWLRDSGCDVGCVRDVQLAADELAATLIIAARTPGSFRLGVTHDDHDVYVTMSVPLAEAGFHPVHPELTRMLLDATADSYDVRVCDDDLVGVLQRSMDSGASDGSLTPGAPRGGT